MNMVDAMHAGHHRIKSLKIDTIHFSVLIGYVQNTLSQAIIVSSIIPMHHKAPLVKAWNKLLWIQMDLFTKWHVKDGAGYDRMSSKATNLDPSTNHFAGMEDDNSKKAKCPFEELSRLDKVEKELGISEGYVYWELQSMAIKVPGGGIGSIESIAGPLSPSSI
jgi:hypothetical protein